MGVLALWAVHRGESGNAQSEVRSSHFGESHVTGRVAEDGNFVLFF